MGKTKKKQMLKKAECIDCVSIQQKKMLKKSNGLQKKDRRNGM